MPAQWRNDVDSATEKISALTLGWNQHHVLSPESLLSGEAFTSSYLLVTEIALFVGLSK